MVEQMPEYRCRFVSNHEHIQGILNELAAQGYELVTATPVNRPGEECNRYIFRLRHDDPAEPTERVENQHLKRYEQSSIPRTWGVLQWDWLAGDVAKLEQALAELGDMAKNRLAAIEARLDGFSEAQGRSERILCDRVAAQAELFATEVAKLVARVQALEGQQTAPKQVRCRFCHGSGKSQRGANDYDPLISDCTYCNGTGIVPAQLFGESRPR